VTGLTRRSLLGHGLAAAPALLLARAPAAAALTVPGPPGRAQLPSARELGAQVRRMVELGPRLTATSPHLQFIDALADDFKGAGLTVTRDPQPFQQWLATGSSLDVVTGANAGPVRIASEYTYSGKTGPAGVTGDLVYLGPVPSPANGGLPSAPDELQSYAAEVAAGVAAILAAVPGGVAGRIVVMDAPIAPLTAGGLDPLLTYRYDPDHSVHETDDYKRAWTTLATLPRLEPFKAAGVAGVVLALDASAANAAGQYTPFIWGYQDLPAVIVDRATGAKLRDAAAGTPRARLVLQATLTQTSSDSLVAVLPGNGSTDEILVVNTHTDGQNAFEENAGIASVALARYFAAQPRLSRNRTLVFSCVTGHFSGGGQPQTQGFITDHPDLIKRAAAAVTIEHFGASEWLDDARGYHPSGQIELGAIFHSQTPIIQPAIESMQASDLRRSELLRPAGTTFFGVGASLHGAGVPSVAFIAGPNYLLAEQGTAGHLDKLDASRYAREVAWAADLLHRLDAIPAAQLAAGDSAVLRPGIAS
jgi:hypothetical protein